MNNNNKKPLFSSNPLEMLKEGAREVAETFHDELIDPISKDIVNQIFGRTEKNYSGEIMPGEAIDMKDIYSGDHESEKNAQIQLHLERTLRDEERILIERRTNELRIQIQAIHEEVVKLANATPQLSRELDVAAFQIPLEPNTYELYFLERLFEFIKSFRKKIEEAHVWLSSTNKRARKKNVWGANYKKHGAKYLLSSEHYLSRSAA
ncbi:hypothetical protein C4564_00215 [Candidatus Microgenomates bacterium]|nr:MAG: hypothetical protein C4564_00215 [Candidatus Microgenomates bacterium]